MKILITGAAGFIGAKTSEILLQAGNYVVGIDNLNEYYDPQLKKDRLENLKCHNAFNFVKNSIEKKGVLQELFHDNKFDIVIHLAAQAGVRYSIENPRVYMESNLIGTFEILEAARSNPPEHMLLASTSSAYGASASMPYCETQKADHQISFYAASKKATESMAHSYSHLYGLPITIFRFFTVYGPWGRPDMAPIKFAKRIIAGVPIDVFNNGNMQRDFTYVDDLVHALSLLINNPPTKTPVSDEFDSLSPVAPFRLVNIGNSDPIELIDFIKALETSLGLVSIQNQMEMQRGDMPATWANTQLLKALTGYCPSTSVEEGVNAFVKWFRAYYGNCVS